MNLDFIIENKYVAFWGSIASIAAYLMIFLPSTYNDILIRDEYGELLTKEDNTAPKFHTKYFYDSIEVDNVMRYEMSLINRSGHTLVGKGPKSDFILKKFTIPIDTSFRLLSLRESREKKLDSISFDNKKFDIHLKQWSDNDEIELTLFLENKSQEKYIPKAEQILKDIDETQIIDGKIKFDSNIHLSFFQKISKKIPINLKKTTLIFTLTLLYFVLCYLTLGFAIVTINIFNKYLWKSKFSSSFKTKLIQHKYTQGEIKKYLKNPEIVPHNVWTKIGMSPFRTRTIGNKNKKSQPQILTWQAFILVVLIVLLVISIIELSAVF